MKLVGYKLMAKDGTIVQTWGGTWGQCPGVPNPISLPTGLTQVHCPEVGADYEDFDGETYSLQPLMMEEPAPAVEGSPEERLAKFLAANPDVMAMIGGNG